ncbi:MAG: DUF6629 family protein, partial [Synechococcaceae cyanobacterium]
TTCPERPAMCFSSAASFIAAGSLVPAGVWALRVCRSRQRPDLMPLALCPWLFAVQQALEGLVWRGLDGPQASSFLLPASLGFLFFAHGFWPAWIPWCSLRAARVWRPEVVPLLVDPGRVLPVVAGGSINYQTRLLGDGLVSHELGVTSYALVVLAPLLLCGSRRLAWYALALLVSVVLSWIAFIQAFTSVWCFMAAVLALLIPWVATEPLATPAGAGSAAGVA